MVALKVQLETKRLTSSTERTIWATWLPLKKLYKPSSEFHNVVLGESWLPYHVVLSIVAQNFLLIRLCQYRVNWALIRACFFRSLWEAIMRPYFSGTECNIESTLAHLHCDHRFVDLLGSFKADQKVGVQFSLWVREIRQRSLSLTVCGRAADGKATFLELKQVLGVVSQIQKSTKYNAS